MGYASDTYANLIREQYADYKSRYLPEQKKLMSLATDNSLMNAQLDRTSENAQNALNTANQEQSNQMSRMGVATQTNGNDNSSSLSSALAQASAKNGTRSAAEERNLSILAGDSARSYATDKYSSSSS
jgi:hypothetical protein